MHSHRWNTPGQIDHMSRHEPMSEFQTCIGSWRANQATAVRRYTVILPSMQKSIEKYQQMEVASFNVWSYIGFPADAEKLGWIQARCTIIHHRKVLPLFRSAVPKTLCRITDITPTMVTQIFRLTSSGTYPISRDFPKRKGFNLGWICAGAFHRRATGSSVRYCWYIILIYLVRLKLDYFRLIHGILKESVQQKDWKIFDTPYLLPSHTSWPDLTRWGDISHLGGPNRPKTVGSHTSQVNAKDTTAMA